MLFIEITKLGVRYNLEEVAMLWNRVVKLHLDFDRDMDAIRALKKEGKMFTRRLP